MENLTDNKKINEKLIYKHQSLISVSPGKHLFESLGEKLKGQKIFY